MDARQLMNLLFVRAEPENFISEDLSAGHKVTFFISWKP